MAAKRKAKRLWKTTIVIWSDYNPEGNTEIDVLTRESVSGGAYCSSSKTVLVRNVNKDPDWDGTEFFWGE